MSKALNLKIHDKDVRPTFFEDVTHGCHTRKTHIHAGTYVRALSLFVCSHKEDQFGSIMKNLNLKNGWHTFNEMECKFFHLQFLCRRFYLKYLSFGRSPNVNAYKFFSRHLVLSWHQEVPWFICMHTCHLCRIYDMIMLLDLFRNLN